MMPGMSARPSALTVSLAAPSPLPTAAILPATTPSSPCTGLPPAPSSISASLITRSNIRFLPPVPFRLHSTMTSANDETLLRALVKALSAVPGIETIVLGGSRARGTATEASDYDIGLYYRAHRPIDVAALAAVVRELDDRGAAASVTEPGGWGPWIDGGAAASVTEPGGW